VSAVDDLDPPSFQFGRRRRRRRPEEPFDTDPGGPFSDEPFSNEPFSDEPFSEEPFSEEPADARGRQTEEAHAGGQRAGLRRLVPEFSETTARVVVAIPWVIFAIAIVAIGEEVFAFSMIVLGVLGLREFFQMAAATRPILLPAYAAVVGMVIAAYYGGSFQILLIFAALFPAAYAFAAARRSHEGITISIAFTTLGVAWIGLGFSHAVLLRDLPTHGGALLIDVLVATFVGDTAAYGAGRLFGSRKITPRISPNKTLEGLAGGFFGATMGFWFAGLYQDWLPGIDALVMGMCIAVIAPIGDLFASLIKRDLEVKDTGGLFGPHGGLIDRLDAVLFTVVAGYYLAVAFVY
jgi:phosphatidate cytidylyltransferase